MAGNRKILRPLCFFLSGLTKKTRRAVLCALPKICPPENTERVIFGKLHTLRSLEYGMLKKIIDMQKSN